MANDPLSIIEARSRFGRRVGADQAAEQKEKRRDALTDAYEAWAKDRESREALAAILKASAPVIDRGLRSYTGSANPVLAGRAKLLALTAIRSFDPGAGASLSGWITAHLQGLKRYAQAPVPVGTPFKVRSDANRLFAAAEEYKSVFGTDPSDDELADNTGLSVKRINYVRKMARPVVAEGSLIDDSGDDVLDSTPAVSTEDYGRVWEEFVYNGLDDRGKRMYDMRTGRGAWKGAPLQVKDIASELGVSSSAVSQQLGRVANQLAEGFQFEGRF